MDRAHGPGSASPVCALYVLGFFKFLPRHPASLSITSCPRPNRGVITPVADPFARRTTPLTVAGAIAYTAARRSRLRGVPHNERAFIKTVGLQVQCKSNDYKAKSRVTVVSSSGTWLPLPRSSGSTAHGPAPLRSDDLRDATPGKADVG